MRRRSRPRVALGNIQRERARDLWASVHGRVQRLDPEALDRQIRLRLVRRDGIESTDVVIEGYVPPVPPSRRPRLEITTRVPEFLPQSIFGRRALEKIAAAGGEGEGRAIAVIDLLLQEVMAVLAYHIPMQAETPLQVTAIAMRADPKASPDLYRRSVFAAGIGKAYLHRVGVRLGRSGELHFDAAPRDDAEALEALGFRRTAVPAEYVPGGVYYGQPAMWPEATDHPLRQRG